MAEDFQHLGDPSLLDSGPVAFFCSTHCDGDAVLQAYAWAREQCDLGTTVISSFHTPIEKDVYAILARRGAKIMHCYASRLPSKRPSPQQKTLIEVGRLLLLAPASCARLSRPTKASCSLRNRFVSEKATCIYTAYIHLDSALTNDLAGFHYKPIDNSKP